MSTPSPAALELSARQARFLRSLLDVLVYVTVLNLFVEYWDRVVIDSFTISLLTAALLAVLLQATLAIEHRIGDYFKPRSGPAAVAGRILATWALLFSSKFVILEIVDLVFGDHVELGGLVPFIVLTVALIVAERLVVRVVAALR